MKQSLEHVEPQMIDDAGLMLERGNHDQIVLRSSEFWRA
jgi:hypothetical protein